MPSSGLTPEIRRHGLEKAKEARHRRAVLRRQLKEGRLTLQEILASTEDDAIGQMRVRYLLQSLPHLGPVTAQRVMTEIGIDENRRVKGLGKRQRQALLEKLG
ncbi:MAG: integration host factor [Firmicutes bacterium]|nr:integration host factor [Bacillota bacterium]